MIIVDRDSFIAWTDGDLLVRDSKGRCIVGDNVLHEEAEKAMESGETIGLTVKGKLISTMSLEDGGFAEKLV